MAGYGTARTLAKRLGLHDIAENLQKTLQEEKAADEKLTAVAESDVNVSATRVAAKWCLDGQKIPRSQSRLVRMKEH